ncbi:MAG: (2Fe-2S)-binding protein [Planctomycetota bacterium]|nr:MAG: (2Fe-2S)-binding protein [Planctomycetota bacterium]
MRFDAWMAGLIVLYLGVFAGLWVSSGGTPETAIIRGFGSLAFLMLSFTLSIGPLSRFSPRFKRLIFNRRHLGVTTFFVGLIHAVFSLLIYFEGDLFGVFTTNGAYGQAHRFPFVPFGLLSLLILLAMATTSHDWWFAKLGVRFWKRLHMLVYLAYTSLALHVGFGVLQDQAWGWRIGFLAVVAAVFSLHLLAAYRERKIDRTPSLREDGFRFACLKSEIPENQAKAVTIGEERVAVIHYQGEIYALTNVCPHQNGPLGEGKVVNGYLECPWHGFQFSPDQGKGPPPYCDKVDRYEVRVDGDQVFVQPFPIEAQADEE